MMNFILALHSSDDTLGVACCNFNDQGKYKLKVTSFPIKRRLSNDLLSCIESIIPAKHWNQLVRLAVAIGPGGFTSTRLTVSVARILAQQLKCPLDGVNTLTLAAYRCGAIANPFIINRPFWLIQRLNQDNIIAGCYRMETGRIYELHFPRLIQLHELQEFEPRFNIKVEVEKDVIQLLRLSQSAMVNTCQTEWHNVTPLYFSSPLDKLSMRN